MADLYGTNAAKANEVPLVLIPQGEKDGAMHLAYDEFVLSGAIIGATDVIKLMKLPAGSMIHNVKLFGQTLEQQAQAYLVSQTIPMHLHHQWTSHQLANT